MAPGTGYYPAERTVSWPGNKIDIKPPQAHRHESPLEHIGKPFTRTFGFDELHGVTMVGTHGAVVTVPRLAAIAAITAGFVGALQRPKLAILTIGRWSLILRFGRPHDMTFLGNERIEVGAAPNVQEQIAPCVASCT